MKRFNIIVLSALAVISLASCELKNELTGNDSNKIVTGTLELGVSVKQPGAQTRAAEETDKFPVVITGASTEVSDVQREYASVSEMPSSVVLPVGKYTVSSHTPGEIQKKMDSPYYGGSVNMTISKDITTSADVICKMKNSRIQLNYGDDFKTSFQSWTITVDDGSTTALSYTDENKEPSPIYWYFDEEAVNAITVNIRATTTEGNTVSESRVFKKSDAAEKYDDVTDFFNGGDALEIKMGTVTSSTGNVDGITINTTITFENHDEIVEIPVNGEETGGGNEGGEEGGGDNPGGETGDGPTLKLPADVTFSLSNDTRPKAVAQITAPATLKSMFVKIIPGNVGFAEALELTEQVGLYFTKDEGVDLVANAETVNVLFTIVGKPEVVAPTTDTTNYEFAIDAFFYFLGDATNGEGEEAHQFMITITDDNDKQISGTFKVNITE